MIDDIIVYKQNHIRIQFGDMVIHVDPFQADSALNDADFIFITHDHYDHFSVKDIERTSCARTVLIVPENMLSKAGAAEEYVNRIVSVKPGESYCIEGLEFETVPSYNIGKPFHPRSAGWVGYILNIGGERVYVAGDTDATEDAMSVKCDIALVPVGGTYTMNAKQAAKLINTIRPKTAIPVHYGGIVGKERDGIEFRKAVDDDIRVVLKIKF